MIIINCYKDSGNLKLYIILFFKKYPCMTKTKISIQIHYFFEKREGERTDRGSKRHRKYKFHQLVSTPWSPSFTLAITCTFQSKIREIGFIFSIRNRGGHTPTTRGAFSRFSTFVPRSIFDDISE